MALPDVKSPFTSSRLIYRTVEKEDDALLAANKQDDPVSEINVNPTLWVPKHNKDAEEYREYLTTKCLLGVIICLKPPPPVTSTELKGNDTAADAAASAPAEKPKPTPIGVISIHKRDPGYQHHRNGDIGIMIFKAYQNKGYGSEAIQWVLWWAFQQGGLHRISIGCFSYNDGARRLYEKLRFVYEGRLRESVWFNGGWHDTIWWSLLEDEWRERVGLLNGRK